MSYPIARGQTVRYVPLDFGPEARAAAEAAGEDTARFDKPLTYLITAPGFLERAGWRKDVATAGARIYSDDQLMQALRREVSAAFDPGDLEGERLVGIIDEFRAMPSGDVPEDLRREVDRIEQAVRAGSREYAGMLAARAHWVEVAPILACQRFLRGTENPGRIFKRRDGLVREEELMTVGDRHLSEVGFHIINALMSPTAAQEKNSASPSSSPIDPATSTAASSPQTEADGTSSGNTTTETPVSA